MEWKLLDSRQENPSTKTLRFSPKKKIEFKPGQFFLFHDLVDNLQDCRAYSASSSPIENEIEITVKLVPKPYFSKHLHVLPKDYTLEVEGPFGDFYLEGVPKEIVLIGAGSGIAPLKSIAQYVIGKQLPTKITVIYSSKTMSSLIFRKELQEWLDTDKIQLFVTLTREKGHYEGRINADLIHKAVHDKTVPEFFICGPPLMVKSVLGILSRWGVDGKKIHSEQF